MSVTNNDNAASDRLLGSTPSIETKETPGWVRLIGLIGMVCFGAGLLMYLWNAYTFINVLQGTTYREGVSTQKDPLVFSFVIFFLVIGVVGMLIQASRDRDVQQRRLLGMIGTILFVLGTLVLTNVLATEGVAQWLSSGSGAVDEKSASQGRWAGLVATIVMALVLLVAWIAPFIRAASETKVSFYGLLGAWLTKMGQARISACTLFGAITLAVLVVLAFFLKNPLQTYSTLVLKYSAENQVAYGVCSYGLLLILIGLPFMLVFSRVEEDEGWSRVPASLLVTVGTLAALFGLVGVFTDVVKVPDFTLPYGLGLAVLGLLCLGLFVGQQGGDSDTGYRVSKWIGLAGLLVIVIAAVRSFLPVVVEMTWLQNWFPSLEDVNLGSYLVPHGFLYLVLGSAFALLGWTLASESKVLVLTRKELGGFFTSAIAYIVLGGTVVVSWLVYYDWVVRILLPSTIQGGLPEPVVQPYLFDWFMLIFILVAVPMLTMRLLSEEHRSGSMEVMLTAPVSETSLVVSKFLATWIFYIFTFVMWLVFPLILRIAGQESFDFRPMMSSVLGLSIVGFSLISMGLFFSSLTKNQIVAFLLTFAGILLMLMLYFVQGNLARDPRGGGSGPLEGILEYITFVNHLITFSSGKVYLKHILFHVTFGLFWLFLTIRVLESRKWR